eukprot:1161125-Pelagomonas_calceolata.AAC.3
MHPRCAQLHLLAAAQGHPGAFSLLLPAAFPTALKRCVEGASEAVQPKLSTPLESLWVSLLALQKESQGTGCQENRKVRNRGSEGKREERTNENKGSREEVGNQFRPCRVNHDMSKTSQVRVTCNPAAAHSFFSCLACQCQTFTGPGFSQRSPDVTDNFEDMEYIDSSGEKEYLSAFVVPQGNSEQLHCGKSTCTHNVVHGIQAGGQERAQGWAAGHARTFPGVCGPGGWHAAACRGTGLRAAVATACGNMLGFLNAASEAV